MTTPKTLNSGCQSFIHLNELINKMTLPFYIFLSILFTTSLFAEEDHRILDGMGLACEVSDKMYERDEELKYFVFDSEEVYWLFITDGNPLKISKFSQNFINKIENL